MRYYLIMKYYLISQLIRHHRRLKRSEKRDRHIDASDCWSDSEMEYFLYTTIGLE